MSEYWVSQARKFCDFCKCWIADQKASIEFHENGKKHKQAVQDRLRDIGRKGAQDEKKTAKEEQWLKQIEQQAMKDYRNKDLQENSDLTARIFNEKRGEREKDRESQISSSNTTKTQDSSNKQVQPDLRGKPDSKPGPPSWGVPTKTTVSNSHIPSKNPFQQRISAKTHGTKYHNPRPETNWREAKTEDGNIYYWNVTSHISVWEPPAEGYVSIREQEQEFEKLNKIENTRKMEEQNKVETQNMKLSSSIYNGPISKPDPYGSWQTVSEKSPSENDHSTKSNSTITSNQIVDDKKTATTNIVLHNDRTKKFEVDSKKTPSLAEDKDFEVDFSAGIKSTTQSKDNAVVVKKDLNKSIEPSKPAIVFRKRKINPDHRKVARRKEDGE